MNTAKKSFWSSVPGVVTGVAGVVGAVVGLITVLISLGVIGNSNSSPTVTTLPPSETSGATSGSGAGTGGSPTTVAKGSFTVDTDSLTLSLLKPEDSVTVSNNGKVPLSLGLPQVSGDKDRFTIVARDCTSSALGPGKSCSIKVTLNGPGAAGSATMVVSADAAASTTTVKLKAT